MTEFVSVKHVYNNLNAGSSSDLLQVFYFFDGERGVGGGEESRVL